MIEQSSVAGFCPCCADLSFRLIYDSLPGVRIKKGRYCTECGHWEPYLNGASCPFKKEC